MSFLYLLKTEKDTFESLYLLQDLLNFAKPKFIGLTVSEDDFRKKYEAYLKSPEYKEDQKKLEFLITTKKNQELAQFKGWTTEDLHNLYTFSWCVKRKCTMIYGDLTESELKSLQEAKGKLAKISQNTSKEVQELQKATGLKGNLDFSKGKDLPSLRAEFFVDRLMERVSPKFSVLPQPLDKTLVGIVPSSVEPSIAELWKAKFKSVYNHRVLETDEVSEEEEKKIIAEQNKKYD